MISRPHDSGDDGDRRDYLKELPTLLRLIQQRVQRDWQQPGQDLGLVSAICLGDVTSDPVDEILIGTDEGHVLAVNIVSSRVVWQTSLGKAIKVIQAGTKDPDSYDTTLLCTGDEQVYALDEHGAVLAAKGRTFPGEHIVCLAVSRRGKQPLGTIQEILIGSQEKQIYIYDANLQNRHITVSVPDVVNVLNCYDLTARDSAEILAGTLGGDVYAYRRQGESADVLWRYPTGACVRALAAKDLDEDGTVEVVVGSDDGNVYVLNTQGQLKWRYYASSPVLAVNVLDIDHDGKNDILLGTADGTLYTLNTEGDVCWTFQVHQPIRDICAGDIDSDGIVEIVLHAGEQLDLLRVIDQQGLQKELQQCIEKMSSDGNAQALILELTNSTDEAVRIFALEALADYYNPNQDYFQRLQGALSDPSSEIRKQAVRAILCLGKIIGKDDIESRRQLERLLQAVAASPEPAIRLSLSNLLHKLVRLDAPLCFEYIRRFTSDPDPWVSRTAVRQLDRLVTSYPIQIFPILCETITSNNEWILLESSRILAHYFDIHSDNLLDETYDLLWITGRPLVMQHIAANSTKTSIRGFFTLLAEMLSYYHTDRRQGLLTYIRTAIPISEVYDPFHEEQIFALYNLFRPLLTARTLEALEASQPEPAIAQGEGIVYSLRMARVLRRLYAILLACRQADTSHGYVAGLLHVAIIALEDLERELSPIVAREPLTENVQLHKAQEHAQQTFVPENMLLALLIQRWRNIIKTELSAIGGGQAKIIPHRAKLVQQGEQYEVSLRISNVGNGEASNVRIVLELDDDGFEIVGSNEQYLETVPPQLYHLVQFTIVVGSQVKALRLSFIIIYDDVSWPNRKIIFSESVKSQMPFREIPNPYNSGEPIRDGKKFFGRAVSLQFLRETLLDVNTRIVLLCGQLRSGKTSLIHQTINELRAVEGYIPVFLDIQELPLECRGPGMLATLATDLLNRLEAYKLTAPILKQDDFQADPVGTFEGFLRQLVAKLEGRRLVLCLDEFDLLEEFTLDQTISIDFVKALIALMKRIDGVSFLLAGGTRMLDIAESTWSMLDEKVKVHHLSQLAASGASELITAPVNGYLNYHGRVIRFIQSLTDNQPYLIHLLCGTLIPICNKRHVNYVDDLLVTSAIDAILDKGAVHFTWVWNRLKIEERLVLSALAWEQKAEEQSVSINDIVLLYQNHGLLPRREQLRQILTRLEEQNYILMVNTAPDRWKIAAGLMREWLQKTKPFKKIMRQR